MGRVYAVVSAKGGVGKTTTTTNLAATLAASGASVAVVDGDLGMANLAGSLGVDSSGATLHDVLAGDAELTDAARPGPHGMTVVPGSTDLDAFARADPEGLEAVLGELADDHDYVLLDTGAGLSNDTVVPLTFVDEILLVSTTGRDALGDTEKTRVVADRLDVPVAGVVATRVDTDDSGTAVVEERLETTVLASVPRADVVRSAGDAGEPLTTYAPGSTPAAAYRALASGLTGEALPDADSTADAASEADEAEAAEPAADADVTAEADAEAKPAGETGPDAEADPATESDLATESDPAVEADSAVEATSDPGGHEDIIVAGDHEADGEPAGDEADPEAPAADPVADSVSPESDAAPEEPADDEPLIRNEGLAERSVPDPDANDPSPTDDEPLIATAEPTDSVETDATSSTDDASDGTDLTDADEVTAEDDAIDAVGDERDEDSAAAGESEEADEDDDTAEGEADGTVEGEADDEDATDADADGEEDGVYTTSLADEASQSEKKEEKKGLFGRFLG